MSSLIVFLFILGCSSLPVNPPAADLDPGWKKAPHPQENLATSPTYSQGILSFSLPGNEDWAAVEVHSSRWTTNFSLEKMGDNFVGSLYCENPDGLEYFFLVKKTNGSQERVLDLMNPGVNWKKPMSSVFYTSDTPLPVLQYFPDQRYLVMLPAGYFTEKEKRYPVMYWHDGQNMPEGAKSPFGGWKADTTAGKMVSEGTIESIIQVGVFNTVDRMTEYTSWSGPVPEELKAKYPITDAQIKKSLDFVDLMVNTIKPSIDRNYRTLTDRNNTGIGGSSAGAMIAMYMGFTHPQVYGKVAAFAGGFMPYMVLRARHFKADLKLKIYLDCGTEGIDKELLPESLIMGEFLQKNGYTQGENLFYKIFDKDQHNEPAWAKRLPGALSFLFPKTVQ